MDKETFFSEYVERCWARCGAAPCGAELVAEMCQINIRALCEGETFQTPRGREKWVLLISLNEVYNDSKLTFLLKPYYARTLPQITFASAPSRFIHTAARRFLKRENRKMLLYAIIST